MTEQLINALNSNTDVEFIKPPITPTVYVNPAKEQSTSVLLLNTLEINTLLDADITKNIINMMQILESEEFVSTQENFIYNVFELIRHACVNLKDNLEFLALVKTWFHEYIVSKKHTSLITIYNTLFTDNLYKEENLKYMYIPTPDADWVKEKIKEYNDEMENINIRKNAKKAPPKYAKNEIVGAKDKEGRWWMSKILHVCEYQGSVVYLVEFIGWGEKFNEFISDGFRINKFNPKKHKYFRPAWVAKNADSL